MYYGMVRVHELLTDLCKDIEKQIKPNLQELKGSFVRGYLPQAWVFETECGACTIFLDSEGNVRVLSGSTPDADVTLHWRKDALESVLALRKRDLVSSGDYPNVTVRTDKGRVAFNFLKKEIGL
jgi:hypothetical protein